MKNDRLQYPTTSELKKYCKIHSNFLLREFGGKCPHCQHNYVFLLSEGYQFKLPREISISSLIYRNLQISTILLLFIQFLEVGFNVVYFLLFVFFYFIFRNISEGLAKISRGSYLLISVFPIFLTLLLGWSAVINEGMSSIGWVLFILMIIFSLPVVLLYKHQKTRNLYNLSDNMYIRLQGRFDFETEYKLKSDKIKVYLQQFILPVMLILMDLTFGIMNYIVIFE